MRRSAATRGTIKRQMAGAVPWNSIIFAKLWEGNLSAKRGIPLLAEGFGTRAVKVVLPVS